MKPLALQEGVIVQPLGNELLVYRQDRDEAHCLNSLTALIWKSSDGTRGLAELTALVRREAQADADDALVLSALECLSQAGLLREDVVTTPARGGVSRRDLLRRVCVNGGMIAASAAVISLLAPTPAQAQTPSPPPPSPPPPTSPP